jgi:hypothetical protein
MKCGERAGIIGSATISKVVKTLILASASQTYFKGLSRLTLSVCTMELFAQLAGALQSFLVVSSQASPLNFRELGWFKHSDQYRIAGRGSKTSRKFPEM